MLQLPHGCSCSQPSVFPSNWRTVSASVKKDWRIQYYFRDPNFRERWPNGKLIVIKGMNSYKTVSERRIIAKSLLEDELRQLNEGYNPILETVVAVQESEDAEITEKTPFIKALRKVHEKLSCASTTKTDIKSTIKYVEISAKALRYDMIPIGEIRRKHIKHILEMCSKTNEKFTDNTYNAYRKNLGILFKELLEQDAVESNVTRDIAKKKTIRKIKKVLTPAECKTVSDWVKNYDRRFWLLINIFFHSGCRTTELFRLKAEHVNLENQTALFTVLKGNQPFEVEKPIKNIAVEFWREALEGAEPGDYLFGKGLIPSQISISPRQATRRWKRHIKGSKKKGKLGITCDWYALKHLNTDQISKERGLKTAGLLNSHSSESTTKIYAINEQVRMNEEIKQMKNKLA